MTIYRKSLCLTYVSVLHAHLTLCRIRWPSFQRQLNIYNFRKLTVGPDAGAYYHVRIILRSLERVLVQFVCNAPLVLTCTLFFTHR